MLRDFKIHRIGHCTVRQSVQLAGLRPNHGRAGRARKQSETVVVTGSRVISDAAQSPTPLTVVSADQLLQPLRPTSRMP